MLPVRPLPNLLAGAGDKETICPDLLEIEHLFDGVGGSVEGPLTDALSTEPVVLNEAQNRSLVGHGVVDEVLRANGETTTNGMRGP